VLEEFEAEVVNPMLCSEKTLKEIQTILRGVVTQGTGKSIDSEYFPIAGKTGTAMIAVKGGYEGYYVSFCGYFPSDNPEYTCFVGIRRPQGSPSGGLMPGAVFKQIAEGIYKKSLATTPVAAPKDTVNSLIPVLKGGSFKNTKIVLTGIDRPFSFTGSKLDWIKQGPSVNNILLEGNSTIKKGLVPDVTGMGARDAIYLLENAGLKVTPAGAGKVKRQSLAAGSNVVGGATVIIELN
jgi:cell division protein FtsI (penicillin-binding protein 3)